MLKLKRKSKSLYSWKKLGMLLLPLIFLSGVASAQDTESVERGELFVRALAGDVDAQKAYQKELSSINGHSKIRKAFNADVLFWEKGGSFDEAKAKREMADLVGDLKKGGEAGSSVEFLTHLKYPASAEAQELAKEIFNEALKGNERAIDALQGSRLLELRASDYLKETLSSSRGALSETEKASMVRFLEGGMVGEALLILLQDRFNSTAKEILDALSPEAILPDASELMLQKTDAELARKKNGAGSEAKDVIAELVAIFSREGVSSETRRAFVASLVNSQHRSIDQVVDNFGPDKGEVHAEIVTQMAERIANEVKNGKPSNAELRDMGHGLRWVFDYGGRADFLIDESRIERAVSSLREAIASTAGKSEFKNTESQLEYLLRSISGEWLRQLVRAEKVNLKTIDLFIAERGLSPEHGQVIRAYAEVPKAEKPKARKKMTALIHNTEAGRTHPVLAETLGELGETKLLIDLMETTSHEDARSNALSALVDQKTPEALEAARSFIETSGDKVTVKMASNMVDRARGEREGGNVEGAKELLSALARSTNEKVKASVLWLVENHSGVLDLNAQEAQRVKLAIQTGQTFTDSQGRTWGEASASETSAKVAAKAAPQERSERLERGDLRLFQEGIEDRMADALESESEGERKEALNEVRTEVKKVLAEFGEGQANAKGRVLINAFANVMVETDPEVAKEARAELVEGMAEELQPRRGEARGEGLLRMRQSFVDAVIEIGFMDGGETFEVQQRSLRSLAGFGMHIDPRVHLPVIQSEIKGDCPELGNLARASMVYSKRANRIQTRFLRSAHDLPRMEEGRDARTRARERRTREVRKPRIKGR